MCAWWQASSVDDYNMYAFKFRFLILSSSTVRVPSDLYEALREIKVALEAQHLSAAPTIQDLVNVALIRFLRDWRNIGERSQILDELLKNRQDSRSRMGRKK
jgi:hypothetical protein